MKLFICMLILSLPAMPVLNAMPISSQPAPEEETVLHGGGATIPEWGQAWGWVSLGCALIGAAMLVDGGSGNNSAGIILLLPGIGWLAFFGH